jgi:hypothetical protein
MLGNGIPEMLTASVEIVPAVLISRIAPPTAVEPTDSFQKVRFEWAGRTGAGSHVNSTCRSSSTLGFRNSFEVVTSQVQRTL